VGGTQAGPNRGSVQSPHHVNFALPVGALQLQHVLCVVAAVVGILVAENPAIELQPPAPSRGSPRSGPSLRLLGAPMGWPLSSVCFLTFMSWGTDLNANEGSAQNSSKEVATACHQRERETA
jgi:hypothetical protein